MTALWQLIGPINGRSRLTRLAAAQPGCWVSESGSLELDAAVYSNSPSSSFSRAVDSSVSRPVGRHDGSAVTSPPGSMPLTLASAVSRPTTPYMTTVPDVTKPKVAASEDENVSSVSPTSAVVPM